MMFNFIVMCKFNSYCLVAIFVKGNVYCFRSLNGSVISWSFQYLATSPSKQIPNVNSSYFLATTVLSFNYIQCIAFYRTNETKCVQEIIGLLLYNGKTFFQTVSVPMSCEIELVVILFEAGIPSLWSYEAGWEKFVLKQCHEFFPKFWIKQLWKLKAFKCTRFRYSSKKSRVWFRRVSRSVFAPLRNIVVSFPVTSGLEFLDVKCILWEVNRSFRCWPSFHTIRQLLYKFRNKVCGYCHFHKQSRLWFRSSKNFNACMWMVV